MSKKELNKKELANEDATATNQATVAKSQSGLKMLILKGKVRSKAI